MALRPPRVLVAAALVVALLGVAVPAVASPQPVPVCSPCDRGFTDAAYGHGMDVEVEHSTATMRVHRNGSATWTVENRLNDTAAATFARNDSLRRSVARDAIAVHDGTLHSTNVTGNTVRMRYRTPDVATDAPGGVLRVEYFGDDGGLISRSSLGADRLTLVAPPGMVVGDALPGADVSSRRMTVTSFDPNGNWPFVTLVPDDAALAPLWSLVAVALPLAPIVGRNVFLFFVLPSAVFAGGFAVLARGARALDAGATTTPDRRASAVVGVGVLALARPLYAGTVVAGLAPSLLAGGVGAVALGALLSLPAVRDQLSESRLAGLVALASALAVATGLLLQAPALPDVNVATLLLPLPVYAATFAGYTAVHTSLRRGLTVAVGSFLAVLVMTFSITTQDSALYFVAVALAVFGAIATVVVGSPFFLLGYGLAD